MGFFKKAKENYVQGQQNAAQAVGLTSAHQQEQAAGAAQGKIGVSGMGANPAAFGGPSTTPLAADDPLLQPVNGLSLEMYAELAKAAQAQGIADEAGMAALGETNYGIPAADIQAALQEWVRRMQQSMVVGLQFNRLSMGR